MNDLMTNQAESAEISSTNPPPTYEQVIRRKTGVSKTTNPVLLRDLRNDADKVINSLQVEIEELKTSIDNTEDDLEALADQAEVESLTKQIGKLDGLKEAIASRAAELLSTK